MAHLICPDRLPIHLMALELEPWSYLLSCRYARSIAQCGLTGLKPRLGHPVVRNGSASGG